MERGHDPKRNDLCHIYIEFLNKIQGVLETFLHVQNARKKQNCYIMV